MEKTHQEATNEHTPPARLREMAKINPTLASLVASNPNATPELLTELADSEEDFIRKNVAANPNTPKEVLWRSGQEFPKEVLENPVFPLLLLENPNLLEEIPYDTLMSFLKCPTVPISFMEWAIAHGREDSESALKLATSSQISRTTLEILASRYSRENHFYYNYEIWKESQLHINYAGELKEGWQEEFSRHIAPRILLTNADTNEQYNLKKEYLLHNLAAIGLVPQLFLEGLAREEEIRSQKKLGLDSNPKVQEEREDIEKFVDYEGIVIYNSPRVIELKKKIAANPNTPVYLLKMLYYQWCERDWYNCNGILAGNPSTPKYLLELFAYSIEEATRKALASNPNIPQSVIHLLARDEDCKVRSALARNPRTSLVILHELWRDGDALVRKAVALNPKVSLDISTKTSETPTPPFSNHYFWRNLFSQIKEQCDVLKLYTPSFLHRYFCKNILVSERECLDFIGCGSSEATKALLRYLRKKPERLSALLELILRAFDTDLNRAIALWHPQMPVKYLALAGWARSLYWLERCAIAQNPNTPIETLQLLAADNNRIVRAAAKENLKSKEC